MNFKKRSLLILPILTILFLGGCAGQDKSSESSSGTELAQSSVEVNIAAASSLTEALTEIQTAYATVSGDHLQFNFAASGALQKQIEEGAPCDLFISAAKSNMDQLEEGDRISTDSRVNLLGNSLVLIAAKEKAQQISSLESLTEDPVTSIAIGTPESVPVGKYAKQSLEKLGLWETLESKFIYTKDVKQVLEYVESGNADCGFVYQTDALLLKTGRVIQVNLADSHDPIVYPMALTADSAQPEAAKRFYDFLQTNEAKAIFEKYGFDVL